MSDHWIGAEYWDRKRAKRGLRTLRVSVATALGLMTVIFGEAMTGSISFYQGQQVAKPSSPDFLALWISVDVAIPLLAAYLVWILARFYSTTAKKLKMAIVS